MSLAEIADGDPWRTMGLRANEILAAANRGQLSGFRNKLINGGFDLWQRGSTFSGLTSGYGPDRWRGASANAINVSRQAFTAGQTDVPGNPRYFMRVTTTGTTDPQIYQPIEDLFAFDNVTCILSFYAKAGAAITHEGGFIQQVFGGGGSATVSTSIGSFALTTSWQRFEKTVVIPSIFGKTIGTFPYAVLRFDPLGSVVSTTDFAQIQLEIVDPTNPKSTPFEQRPLALELALAQRYFEKSFALDTTPAQNIGVDTGEATWVAQTAGSSTGQRSQRITFRTRKRIAPSMTLYNPAAANSQARDETLGGDCSTTSSPRIGEDGICFFTAGNASTAQGNKLGLHWTAAAEF